MKISAILIIIFSTTFSYSQDIHVEGDILLNHGNHKKISVETSPIGNGFDLSISAGNTPLSTNQGGNLYLSSGESVFTGAYGSVFIYNRGNSATFSSNSIKLNRRTEINRQLKLRGGSTIGSGNSAAFDQLEFVNPFNDKYSWILGPQSSPVALNDNDFYFYVQRNTLKHVAGWIQDDNTDVRMNFTGQHRSLIKDIDFSDPALSPTDFSGLIVVADQNEYMSMSNGLSVGQKAIMIDESLPVLSISKTQKDKRVFGVISGIEPEDREDSFGAFTTPYEKEEGDHRVFVNSLGEGGIWVVDENGPLSSGDYIVTSNVPGYGMKQNSEFLANYTVAKITMDCSFKPPLLPKRKIKKEKVIIEEHVRELNALDNKGQLIWEQDCDEQGQPLFESAYKVRFLLPDGTRITKNDFEIKKINGEEVYRAAFVGCTYHCG